MTLIFCSKDESFCVQKPLLENGHCRCPISWSYALV